MEELDLSLIKKKSVTGILALTSRTFVMQFVAFGAMFFLTIFLDPSVFGVFYVVSAIINFLNYFSDIGLAAALIQKQQELTRDDLVTTFTIQQLLVGSLSVIVFISAPYIANFYNLDASGVWLMRALIFSFFLSSLKTIPSILLERKLAFNLLVIPQLVETIGFYAVAVFLAWKGFGVESFTWAVLIRGVLGVFVIYKISPFRITFGISRSVTKKLLTFGVPFQLNSFLALIKDDLLTIFLGKVLTFTEVGYIGWAKKWAEVPLRLIMDSIIRVTFPTYSRLQKSKDMITKAINRTLYGLALAMFPITALLVYSIRPVIDAIPKYVKWEPAVFSFFIFAFTSLLAGLSTPLTNALNAIGKIKITLKIMIFWTLLTWVFVVLGINSFGFNGVALALFIVSLTMPIVVYELKKHVPISFLANIIRPALSAGVMSVFLLLFVQYIPRTRCMIVLSSFLGVILYVGVLYLIDKDNIKAFLRVITKQLSWPQSVS